MSKDTDKKTQTLPDSAEFELLAQEADPEIAAAIRAALTEIEPEPGAETRMYQNILKKAAAKGVQLPDTAAHAASATNQTPDFSAANQTSAATPIRSAAHRKWRRYLSLAACLVLVLCAGLLLPEHTATPPVVPPVSAESPIVTQPDPETPDGNARPSAPGSDTHTRQPSAEDDETQAPPAEDDETHTPPAQEPPQGGDSSVQNPSPFVDVDGPEDFADLKLSITAPEGASEVSYCIAYETTARVDFTLDSHTYIYLAARTDTDLSGVNGDVQESRTFTLPNADGKETTVILEWLCIVEDDTPSGADTSAADDSDLAAASGSGASADADAPGIWRAFWQTAGVSYCLLNEDGAAEDAVCTLLQTLTAQN